MFEDSMSKTGKRIEKIKKASRFRLASFYYSVDD
jgi:hypothetical protein